MTLFKGSDIQDTGISADEIMCGDPTLNHAADVVLSKIDLILS